MPEFSSYSQIEPILLKILMDAISEVGDRANKLLREHVVSDVYNIGDSMGIESYKRTGDLESSVTTSNVKVYGNELEVQVFHDPDKMEYDPENFIHGSRYFEPNDVREMLPYLIDQGKTGGMFGNKWKDLMRPYMSNTIAELKDNTLEKWMVEALAKRGVSVSFTMSVS